MIKTVIFDLDDTLYDEVDYCRSGFAAVATFLADHPNTPSKQVIFEALWGQFSGGNHTKTFNAALDQLLMKYDQTLISDLINQYRYHAPSLVLPEDSKHMLEQLSTSHTLGLISDGFLPAQQLKVAALGIEKHFKAIIYTEALGRQFWKPSPVAFERILEMLSAEPQESVYVADNPEKDFIAPNQLGWATIQIIRPARVHIDDPTNPDAKPQHIIDNITKLPDMLENL